MSPSTDELARDYVAAKREIINKGYIDEIAWQLSTSAGRVTRQSFVRECAWVILSSGMAEVVVRKIFPRIDQVSYGFDPVLMVKNHSSAVAASLRVFGHRRKVDAIFSIASTVCAVDDTYLLERLKEDAEDFLRSLPYIGPVTWAHLAKNLGVQVSKSDRHLARVAGVTQRDSVEELCREISDWLGEPLAVVDLVLWRWSVVHIRDCKSCSSSLHRRAN